MSILNYLLSLVLSFSAPQIAGVLPNPMKLPDHIRALEQHFPKRADHRYLRQILAATDTNVMIATGFRIKDDGNSHEVIWPNGSRVTITVRTPRVLLINDQEFYFDSRNSLEETHHLLMAHIERTWRTPSRPLIDWILPPAQATPAFPLVGLAALTIFYYVLPAALQASDLLGETSALQSTLDLCEQHDSSVPFESSALFGSLKILKQRGILNLQMQHGIRDCEVWSMTNYKILQSNPADLIDLCTLRTKILKCTESYILEQQLGALPR